MSASTPSIEERLLNIASQSVKAYRETAEQWLEKPRVLEKCWQCEAWFTTGLEALAAVLGVDMILHEGAKKGSFDLTPEIQETVFGLYELWLKPGALAEQRIATLHQQGQTPSNAAKIRATIHQIRILVEERKKRPGTIECVGQAMLQGSALAGSPPAKNSG